MNKCEWDIDFICEHVDRDQHMPCNQQNCPDGKRQADTIWWKGHPGALENNAGSGLKAVGITNSGVLHSIITADNCLGMIFTSLIVSTHHRQWFKDNEKILRSTLPTRGHIIVFADANSEMEIF